MFSGGRKMERFSNPSASSSAAAAAATQSMPSMMNDSINLDDPYSLKLERLDILNMDDSNPFMQQIIEQRKNLLDDSRIMIRLLGLDHFIDNDDDDDERLRRKKMKAKKLAEKKKKTATVVRRRYNIDDDDDNDQPVLVGDIMERDPLNNDNKMKTNDERIDKNDDDDDDDDDDNDEEILNNDSMEEDNDYMETYFDNGEDFID